MTPASKPTTTESEVCHHMLARSPVSLPKRKYMMPKVATAISTAAALVPRLNAPRSSFMPAFSLVFTRKIPMMESNTPTAAISIGASTALNCKPSTAAVANAEAPKAIVAKIEPA